MTTITIKVNNAVVLDGDSFEKTREAIKGILTTKNVDSATVKNALQFVGGETFAVSIEKNGKASDVVEVYESEKLTAKYTRGNTVKRIRVALDVDSWSGQIFTEKTESKSGTTQEIAAF